jgi:membrane protease YdiL (CAAX protease family)
VLCYAETGRAVENWVHELKWNAIAYAVVAAVGLTTVAGFWLFVPALRRHWLPLPRLRPGAWTGHEVILAFCIFLGTQVFVIGGLYQVGFYSPLIGPTPPTEAPASEHALYSFRCLMLSSPFVLTLVLGILMPVLYARTGTRPHHYGLSWGRWPANVCLGIVIFVLARPVIIGIFVLAQLVFPERSDSLDAFGKSGPAPWEWSLLAFQTTVAAPVLEEVICRGILQGWLRRASLMGHILVSASVLLLTVALHNFDWAAAIFAAILVAGYALGLYRLARQFGLAEQELAAWQPAPSHLALAANLAATEEEARELRQTAREIDDERARQWADANARLAIFGSAMLFASLHGWPAAVAMFPMGLILGWLFHRTQSLVGPITMHALFNLTTFIAFYGSVLSPG